MGFNLTQKIIKDHLVDGVMEVGQEVAIRMDQTLTQDSTGTMAYLQLEAMEIERVKTQKSVAYIDHNILQTGSENGDDHKYIETVASKYGIYFSRPGNGICHQVHLERFASPGMTLLGSDSHTPTCGGMGMLAIGAGGLDVAVAMAGGAYYLNMPKVVKVDLKGKLRGWATAKDIILEILRRVTVKGGVGKIFEYAGEGVGTLTVPERSTITNMGAELGATTSLFPSDENTKEYLQAQGRRHDFIEFLPDQDATYDEVITIELDTLEPLVSKPHSPDHVVKISQLEKVALDQVAVGSCTNSSYMDLMKVAKILKGKMVHPNVSLVVSPGSRQVLEMISRNGALADLISSGARILESACGPCIGMGQAPRTNGVSLRTFNRNFPGRSGTKTDNVYLGSPELAAQSAVLGYIGFFENSKEDLDVTVELPKEFLVDDRMILPPAQNPHEVEIIRGPNIMPFPKNGPLKSFLTGQVLIKLSDNITTDHIMPSGAKLLPYRSNIPYLSNYCLTPCDPDFPKRAEKYGGGFIIGGENYGQGSSREHAALVPLYLGIKGVLAKSFARIHKNNLINAGILPLNFKNPQDYEKISKNDTLEIHNIIDGLTHKEFFFINKTTHEKISVILEITDRQASILKEGGLLNYTKTKKRSKLNGV
jgi:aconitate hydratase